MITQATVGTPVRHTIALEEPQQRAQTTCRSIFRFVMVSMQLAVLLPLAPAILLAWAVYWCVDREGIAHLNEPSTSTQRNCFGVNMFHQDFSEIGVL